MIWHIVTPEYPPQIGGVGDYAKIVAEKLAERGAEVHIWFPGSEGSHGPAKNITIHPLDRFSRLATLFGLRKGLRQFSSPGRLFIQWVPHGYGMKSMNLPLCFWLLAEAVFGHHQIELMVHEPSLEFKSGAWRQNMVAIMHRFMTIVLMRAADRVYMSIPSWEQRLRPYSFGRRMLFFDWLPVPSTVTVTEDPSAAEKIRNRLSVPGQLLIGHFGTHSPEIRRMLGTIVPAVLSQHSNIVFVMLGKDGQAVRDELPTWSNRIQATGILSISELSNHIAACDLFLQPYPDGVSTRRTSAMAALSHGLALVTNTGKLSESFWHENRIASAVSAETGDLLIAEVTRLLSDKEARKTLGAEAKRFYDEHFTPDRLVSTLLSGRDANSPSLLAATRCNPV